jgi:hypothetical protein
MINVYISLKQTHHSIKDGGNGLEYRQLQYNGFGELFQIPTKKILFG